MAEQWVVFAKPCLAHTESVIGYLGKRTGHPCFGPSRTRQTERARLCLYLGL